MGNREFEPTGDIVNRVREEGLLHRLVKAVQLYLIDLIEQFRAVLLGDAEHEGHFLLVSIFRQQGRTLNLPVTGIVLVDCFSDQVLHRQGQGIVIDGVGVLRVTGRVGGRGADLRVDMALERGGLGNAKARPDKTAHKDKGADHGDQDVKPHIRFGGEALFLHKLTAAVDDQRQQQSVSKTCREGDQDGRVVGRTQQRERQSKGDRNKEPQNLQDLPPFAGPGREQDALFLGGGPGFSAPAVVADQLHDGLDAQHQPDENSRQGKSA